MRSQRDSVRVVVVGAGHAGLVCAARLASRGVQVTVLEQGKQPGGALGSQARTLPGFVHDHCAGVLPLTAASPAFRDLPLARRALASSATFGLEVLGDARAAAWMSGSAVHSDLTPGSSGGAAFALFLKLLAHIVGWPFPRGGAGRLTDALVAHLRSLGGDLRCGAAVRSIELRNGRVHGVRLTAGEALDADAVVTTISARPLAALLPEAALSSRLTSRLRSWRYGVDTFKVDFALDGPVPWTSAEARSAGVVHLGDTLDALFSSQQEAGLGRVPSEPAMVVGQQSLHDASRAPAGKHTLYVYTHVPARPGLADAAIADRIEQRIERFAPGFRDLVLARDVRSPERLERENPSLVGGDLAAGSMELDQQGPFRPAPELIRYRAPLRGLYVAGASTHPGPGVHGVSGRGAADALLADLSPLRFWR